MNCDDLGFDSTASALTVTQLRERFPAIPLRVLVTLWFVTLMERTVTPFRLCECGCGAAVHGKARLDSAACRQRVSRQRRSIAATGPKQFGLVLQHEIPVPIPTVPPPRPAPAVQVSEISEPVVGEIVRHPDFGDVRVKSVSDSMVGFTILSGKKQGKPGMIKIQTWLEDMSVVNQVANCSHETGYISLDGDCSGYFCGGCEQLVTSIIPDPPERLGYVSAIWKHWAKKFPNRYPCKVKAEYCAIPLDDEEKEFLGGKSTPTADVWTLDDSRLTEPRVCYRVNCDILRDGKFPNGKRLKPADVQKLTAENEHWAKRLREHFPNLPLEKIAAYASEREKAGS